MRNSLFSHSQPSRWLFAAKPLAIAISASAFLAATSPAANAALSPGDRDFNQRIYVGANVGLTRLEPRTAGTAFKVGDDSSSGGSLTLGYDLTKHFSVEGFFANLGQAEIARRADNVKAGDIDYKSWGASLIGYFYNSRRAGDYMRGFDDEGFYRREGLSAFARVGLSRLDTTGSVDFKQLNDTGIHLGAGLEYGWSNGIAARAELISYDEDSKLVSIGILKRFGQAKPYPAPAPAEPTPQAEPEKPAVAPPPPAPEKPALPVAPPTVLFDFDRYNLTGVARAILDSFVADMLQPDPRLHIRINGHTDSVGTESYNQKLSIRRAQSVRKYLENKGIASDRMEIRGFGETQPLNDNATPEKRALNRRVEFELLKD